MLRGPSSAKALQSNPHAEGAKCSSQCCSICRADTSSDLLETHQLHASYTSFSCWDPLESCSSRWLLPAYKKCHNCMHRECVPSDTCQAMELLIQIAEQHLLDLQAGQALPGPCHQFHELQVCSGTGQRQPKALDILAASQRSGGRQMQLGA